jgi:hypothetical protein
MEWLKKGSGFVALSTLFTTFDNKGFDAINTGIATHNQAGFAIVGF